MGPMMFNWQNECTGDPGKKLSKKTHEAQNATPANAEVILKRGDKPPQRTPYRIYCTCLASECQGQIRQTGKKFWKPQRDFGGISVDKDFQPW